MVKSIMNSDIILPRPENPLADFQLPEISSVVQNPCSSDASRAFAPVGVEVCSFIIVAQVNFLRSIAFAERPLVVAAVHGERVVRIVVVISHHSFSISHFLSEKLFPKDSLPLNQLPTNSDFSQRCFSISALNCEGRAKGRERRMLRILFT